MNQYEDYEFDDICPTCGQKFFIKRLDEAMAKIEALEERNAELQAEVEVLREQDKWVHVDDEKPETLTNFLVYGGSYIGWAFLNSNNIFIDIGNQKVYESITHWMPLPKPPQVKNENKKD